MLAAQGIPVVVAVAFPRPVFRKDFDLKVGLFAALLAAAFEELFKVIDVLSVAVGEGRQATGVPAHISKLRAATGEAQDVGGCTGLDMVEAYVEERLCTLAC